MYQSPKKEKYILKDVNQIRKRLNQDPSGQTILPNFTPFTYAEKSQINKFRIGLEALKLPCDLHTAKEDFLYFYRQISNDSQSFNALSEKSNQLLSVSGFDDPRYRNIFDIYCSVGIAYRVINNTLRLTYESSVTSYLRFPFHFLYNGIKEGYWKDEPKDKQLILWRGGKMNELELLMVKRSIGGFVQVEGFMSTSELFEVGENFCINVLFKVIVPVRERTQQGNHGYLNLAKISIHIEKQYLFNALNIFKIVSVEEKVKDLEQNNKKIYHLITLQYGSLPECLAKKLKNSQLKQEQEDLLNNYENFEHLFSGIKNQGIALFQLGEYDECKKFFSQNLQYDDVIHLDQEKIKEIINYHFYLMKINNQFDLEKSQKQKAALEKIFALRKDLNLQNQKIEFEYQKIAFQTQSYFNSKTINLQNLIQNKNKYLKFLEQEQKTHEIAARYTYLNTHLARIYLLSFQNNQKSSQCIEKAKKFIEENYPKNKRLRALLNLKIGILLIEQQKYNQAIQLLNKSDEIYSLLIGDYHRYRLAVLNLLFVAHQRKKDYQQALQCMKKQQMIKKYLKMPSLDEFVFELNKANILEETDGLEDSLNILRQMKQKYIDKQTIKDLPVILKAALYIYFGKVYLRQKNIAQMKVMRKIGQYYFAQVELKEGGNYRSILEQLEEIRKIQ